MQSLEKFPELEPPLELLVGDSLQTFCVVGKYAYCLEKAGKLTVINLKCKSFASYNCLRKSHLRESNGKMIDFSTVCGDAEGILVAGLLCPDTLPQRRIIEHETAVIQLHSPKSFNFKASLKITYRCFNQRAGHRNPIHSFKRLNGTPVVLASCRDNWVFVLSCFNDAVHHLQSLNLSAAGNNEHIYSYAHNRKLNSIFVSSFEEGTGSQIKKIDLNIRI